MIGDDAFGLGPIGNLIDCIRSGFDERAKGKGDRWATIYEAIVERFDLSTLKLKSTDSVEEKPIMQTMSEEDAEKYAPPNYHVHFPCTMIPITDDMKKRASDEAIKRHPKYRRWLDDLVRRKKGSGIPFEPSTITPIEEMTPEKFHEFTYHPASTVFTEEDAERAAKEWRKKQEDVHGFTFENPTTNYRRFLQPYQQSWYDNFVTPSPKAKEEMEKLGIKTPPTEAGKLIEQTFYPNQFAMILGERIGLKIEYDNRANRRVVKRWIEVIRDPLIKRLDHSAPLNPVVECPKIFKEYLYRVLTHENNINNYVSGLSNEEARRIYGTLEVDIQNVRVVQDGIEFGSFVIAFNQDPNWSKDGPRAIVQETIHTPMFVECKRDNPCIEPLNGSTYMFEEYFRCLALTCFLLIEFQNTVNPPFCNVRAKRGEGENNETND